MMFDMVKDNDKPPSSTHFVGFGSGGFPSLNSLAKRLENIRTLWSGDWDFPPIRGLIHNRRITLSQGV